MEMFEYTVNLAPSNEEKAEAIKKISEKLEFPEESVKEIYGVHILSPGCVKVGERMKKMREKEGLPVEALSKELSCPPDFLELVEEGLIPPSSQLTITFSNYFNVLWHSVFKEIKDVKI